MAFVVQSPSASKQTTQNPALAFVEPVTGGNLLVLFFSWANTSGAVSSVVDSLGNIWQQFDFQQPIGTLRTIYCFAAQSTADGACTVTINTDASRTYTIVLYEVSGGTAVLDGAPVHTSTTSSTPAPATGTLATSFSGSIVFATTICGNLISDPPAPWVPNDTSNTSSVYQIPGSAGSFSAAWTCVSNTWATTILAFQATAAGPPPALGPYPIISDLPLTNGLLATPAVLASPIVGMVSYRSTWKVLQPNQPGSITNNPNDPSFVWAFLDQCVAQATYYKKLISLHVALQGFGQPNWVKANAQQFQDAAGDPTVAVYYDTYYQNAVIAFIQAMGARYKIYPQLYKVVITIPSRGSSWDVPHTAADIANWIGATYLYTTTKLVNAATATLSAAAAAFPNSYIQLQVGTSGLLDPYPGAQNHDYNAATQIAQWGYANVAKFAMDRDGFDPEIDTPSQALALTDESGWYLLAQALAGSTNTSGTTGTIPAGGTVFGQANWPAVDPSGQYTYASTNGYKANGGIPYTNPVPVVLGTITAAQWYFAKVIEIYEQDIAGVLASPIAGEIVSTPSAPERFAFPFNRK